MQITRPLLAHSLSARRMRHGLNVALLCALGSCALPAFAGAQQTKSVPVLSSLPIMGKLFLKQAVPVEGTAELRVSVEAKGVTLGTVVDLLMDQAHASYTLDASLALLPTGNVKLRKVPFSIALETILKMSHGRATYRVENGIYSIVEREPAPAESVEANPPKTTKETPKEDGPAATATPDGTARPKPDGAAETLPTAVASTLVTVDANKSDLYSVLKLVFAQVKANYSLGPNLRNIPVTIHIRKLPFSTALDMLLKETGKPLTYRVENGIWSIVPKT